MEKFKKIAEKLLFPPKVITFMLIAASAVSLVYVFTKGMENTAFAYVTYLVSFYTLCVITACIPFYYRKYKEKIYNNPYTAKYITEKELRVKLSMVNGIIFNFIYAVLKLMAGVYYSSVWIGAVAIYYMLLLL